MILPRSDVVPVAALDEIHYRSRMSLTYQSLSAVFWSGADVFMRQALQFFVSILLARLLSPEDFGLLAMLYLFTGIAGLFIDSGFSSALVQRQDITPKDESTVFFFNLGAGLVKDEKTQLF